MRLVALAIFAMLSVESSACSLPVFRHALERWTVGDYRLEVPISETGNVLIGELLANSVGNIRIDRIEGIDQAVLLSPKNETPLWTGSFDKDSFKRLIASPARQELVARIMAGESAVWVLVAPGSERKELRERLTIAITQFESNAKLPVVSQEDLGAGPELQLKFSVLELDIKDPNEAEFISVLGGTQNPQNAFIAPVFGRGRVLGVMKPEAATPKNIEQTCRFLIGSCSCQLDVGWDLLLAVDWNAELQRAGRRSISVPHETTSETVTLGTTREVSASNDHSRAVALWGVIVVALIGGAMWMLKRLAH